LALLVTRLEHLLSAQVLAIVQRHAATFLSLAATEYSFHHVKPSLMVAAAILTAIHGLCPAISSQTGFPALLCGMVGAGLQELVLLVRMLEVKVAGWIQTATGEPATAKLPVSSSDPLHKRQKTKQTLQAFCDVRMDTTS
jgi:hypothetical protein